MVRGTWYSIRTSVFERYLCPFLHVISKASAPCILSTAKRERVLLKIPETGWNSPYLKGILIIHSPNIAKHSLISSWVLMFCHSNGDLKMASYIPNAFVLWLWFHLSLSFSPFHWICVSTLINLLCVAQASAVSVACSPCSIQVWCVLPLCLCRPTLHMRHWVWTSQNGYQRQTLHSEPLWAAQVISGWSLEASTY